MFEQGLVWQSESHSIQDYYVSKPKVFDFNFHFSVCNRQNWLLGRANPAAQLFATLFARFLNMNLSVDCFSGSAAGLR